MATARLIDSQKQELVRRFRQGESTQALADHFGCSATTITRMVRAELGPEDYAALRDQRQRKAGRDRQIPLAIASEPGPAPGEPESPPPAPETAARSERTEPLAARDNGEDGEQPLRPEGQPQREIPSPASSVRAGEGTIGHADSAASGVHNEVDEGDDLDANNQIETSDPIESFDESETFDVINRNAPTTENNETNEEPLEPQADSTTVLAIDDADDFADDGDSEDDLLTSDEDGEDEDDGPLDNQDFHPVAVLPIVVDDQHETRPAPWTPDVLPSCAYLLVDKTVELQARPLGEIPELGRLPMEEQDQQALVLFTNPRQAKRHCGRTQRVIKLPDPALLGRTAPYLRAQGISRVVIEGALYALPGGQ
jgi:hypothetical protein